MFTILGAGGSIATEVAKTLFQNKTPFTLVSRHAHSVYGGLTLSADLTSRTQTDEVVKGASHVLLCPGLTYDIKVWAKHWPLIMNNTIEACKKYNTKLIFFDNVYMLGKVKGPMTEATPNHPVSAKGVIREKLANQVMEEVEKGNLNAVIARSADFYGPNCKTSLLNIMVLDNLAKKRKARWLMDENALHSFTFTPDCGEAIWMLYNNDNAWNQIWHMPTAHPPLTGKQLIEIAARIFEAPAKYSIAGEKMVGFLGIFMKVMKEMKEMLYQYDSDYVFDSTKFEKAFNFTPTSCEQGIELVAASYKK